MGSSLVEYCESVLDGRIVACDAIRRVCERLRREVDDGCGPWHFDIEEAQRRIGFVERFCKVPSGKLGAPLRLELYERAWMESIYGFVDDRGTRRVQEALIEVGRKNGKTTFAAAMSLASLMDPDEGSPQVYCAANSLDQARLLFAACGKMRALSPAISKHVRKSGDRLECDFNLGFMRPLSARPTTMDGFDVHHATLDEIHEARTDQVYSLLKQGTSARRNPLITMITTNGFVRDGFLDQRLDYARRWLDGDVTDNRFLAFLYELDARDQWDQPDKWVMANPGLGTVKSMDYMLEMYERVKQDPSLRPTFMTKDLDMPENASMAWLTFEEAVNEATFDEFPGFGIVGFDAADTTDLMAAQMLVMRPGDDRIYEHSMYWMTEDRMAQSMLRNVKGDGVPYALWQSRGLLRTVDAPVLSPQLVVDWIAEMRDEHGIYAFACGFDPWHVDDSTKHNLELLCGKGRVFPVRQGAITLSSPMKEIRGLYAANMIVDNHNPVNEFCRMNVSIKVDTNGNLSPVKLYNDPRNRIDGWAAEIDAYVTLCNLRDDYLAMVGS